MNRYFYFLILLLSISSCEDVIDVDVPEGDPRLVIDASFEFYLTEDPIAISGNIRLSESAPFFDEIPAVNSATVFVTNLSDNSVINFENVNENGIYEPIDFTVDLIPEFGIDYELTVIYNNEIYKATTQLFPSVPINSVEQGDGTLFEGDETEIIVTFTDDGTRDDFYLFDFDFNLLEVSEDRFYQGEMFTFSYFYENMFTGDDVTIKLLGIDERYFNYALQIIELSDQNDGDPFQVPPSTARGNIINISNPDNFALGYFNLSEAYRIDFTIE